MHALRHVHRLLVPDGTLVDVHPVTEGTVEVAGEPLGLIEEPDWIGRELPDAEAGLREAIGAHLYVLEEETSFDLLTHFDTAGELLADKHEHLARQPELSRRIRAVASPLQVRERLVLRRLRAA